MFVTGERMSPDPRTVEDRKFLDFMCRHLVVLCADYHTLVDGQPQGEEHNATVSGFVMVIGGRWCFTTAGHILQDERALGDSIRRGLIRVNSWRLFDFFGPDPVVREATPFHFDLDTVAYLRSDEDSLDFALLPLEEFFASSLRGNNIIPITRENWAGSDRMEFEGYAMVGVPAPPPGAPGMRATLVPIRRITELPENIVQPARDWFMGQVNVPFDIGGMSGGPIFGYYRNTEGQLAYRTMAIQSGWFSGHQIILGCPNSRFMTIVDAEIERIWQEGG
jgi:hypothetical protein